MTFWLRRRGFRAWRSRRFFPPVRLKARKYLIVVVLRKRRRLRLRLGRLDEWWWAALGGNAVVGVCHRLFGCRLSRISICTKKADWKTDRQREYRRRGMLVLLLSQKSTPLLDCLALRKIMKNFRLRRRFSPTTTQPRFPLGWKLFVERAPLGWTIATINFV